MTDTCDGTAPVATRYRVECRAAAATRLPWYAGSTLRGPFGLALRRLSCVTGLERCGDCPLYRACAYPEIFETPPGQGSGETVRARRETPRPYVVEPPGLGVRKLAPSGAFTFFVGLLGRAQRHAELVRKAFAIAGREGTDFGRFKLAEFSPCDAAIMPPPEIPRAGRIRIEFLTPARIVRRGRILDAGSLDFPSFAWSLTHRLQRLQAAHGAYPAPLDVDSVLSAARQLRESDRALVWKDAARWSNTQGRRMPLGGVVGTWALNGDFADLWPLLHTGQWTHVGKEAVFGLGQYRLTSLL